MRVLPLLAAAFGSTIPGVLFAAQQPIQKEVVATGLYGALLVRAAPGDDASRIFVGRQTGQIRIVKNGVVLPTPFLDLTAKIISGGERGVLGLAFHPDYEQNGYFYVNYTASGNGNTRIERYEVDPQNPDVALPNSAFTILEITQSFANHNGGWIEFGPDGHLFIGMGDGGSFGDPGNRAQNGQELLGKILRIDVDNPAGGLNYGIPSDNPFIADPNVRDEIWALGLRNPWRCDFDDLTGDLWIADVGQNLWEEVNFQPAGQGGNNYGWRLMEGEHCYNPSSNCNPGGLTMPLREYAHGPHCSITGGVVYRGRSMATMHGRYFYGDYCSGLTWSMRQSGGTAIDVVEHTAELGALNSFVSMGEDADGEIYLCRSGEILRIVPAGLRLILPHMFGGAAVTATVRGGVPNQSCGLFFSKHGLGATRVPAAQVRLDIGGAELLAIGTTDGQGIATFSGTVPANLQDRTLWVQAAQFGVKSNVVVETVE